MALTAGQYQALIPIQIGDTGIVTTNMATLWAAHDTVTDLPVRALLVKRDGIEMLMGQVWERVNQAGNGKSADLSDQLAHLKTMYDATVAALEGAGVIPSGQAKRGYAVGALTQTAPVMPAEGQIVDPNHPIYRGSPYDGWRL